MPAAAAPSLVGTYRVTEGPDVAGELRIAANHRFDYALAAGALDEAAQGRWEAEGTAVCLYTEPRPVPPKFTLMPHREVAADAPCLLVTWPDGRGVALIDFVIGFDHGDPLSGYTQDYGWSLPPDEKRIPRWIDLAAPVMEIKPQHFALDARTPLPIRALLTPNDIGVVDFLHACLEPAKDGFVLHREGGTMRLARQRR